VPVTVVVGGQYGSEGKGKVAFELTRRERADFAIRVGGPNSGHTVVDDEARRHVFRQVPAGVLVRGVTSVIPAGAYIDIEVLRQEIERYQLKPANLVIDPNAVIISQTEKNAESKSRLDARIGSTLSGTGSAVIKRIERTSADFFANSEPSIVPFIQPSRPLLREALLAGKRVIIEGTQGFGLSLLHSSHYPNVTSRDTTAAAVVSEAGLSPLDVDQVVLVTRAYPIRVAGNSGPLRDEIDWETVSLESGSDEPLVELTTVTRNVRRIGRFDPQLVRDAILSNRPTSIVLNHLDYVDASLRKGARPSPRVRQFVAWCEKEIGQRVDWVGTGPDRLLSAAELMSQSVSQQ
jgi:adenylosuccinate synthase